jgi:ABC-2 type transport system permease protein
MTTLAPETRTSPPKRSAFTELAATNARELVRDGKTMFFIVFFPLFFLGLFGFLGFMIDSQNDAPVVEVVAGEQSDAILAELDAAGIDATITDDATPADGTTAIVTANGDTAQVVLDSEAQPQWRPLVDAVSSVGIAKPDIAIGYEDGSAVFDPLKNSLASIVMVSFLTLALLGTAVPVVGQRGKGILRVLGTTPLKRSTYIAAQSPARLIIGVLQLAIVVVVTAVLGYLRPSAIPGLVVTALLGLAMLFAIGYLIGSRARNPESTTTVVSLLIPVALMLSGSIFPLTMFPQAFADAVQWLPTTVLAKALSVDLVGADTGIASWAYWLYLAGVGIVAAVLAGLAFRWDQGEQR